MTARDSMTSGERVRDDVAALVARARAAQRVVDGCDQARADELATAAGWAIVEPSRNRALAELAVRDTGLGDAGDKFAKNRRKTMGLLRDLRGAKSVGVIAEHPERGIVEIARPVGVVAAITPSTNPAATPANNVVNALKGRNAIVIAPSPKGASTLALLLSYVHAELDAIGAPRDLVLALPSPVTREHTNELMRQADLVVATGSANNVRAAYASGTPALGVGAGNVAAIVDETADLAAAAARIARRRTRADGSPIAARSPKMYRRIIRSALMARSREVFKRRRGESGGAIGERIERRLAEWRKDLGKALKGVNSHAKKRAIAEALRYGREKKAFVAREAEKMRAERRAVLRGQMAAARERESASPTSSDDSR